MSSFSSPARSGPNSTAARRPRPLTSRRSSAAARAVAHRHDDVARARAGGEDAVAVGDGLRHAVDAPSRRRGCGRRRRRCARRRSCGQPSRGATRRRWNSPPLAMARATAPMLSASCGRTSTMIGLSPGGGGERRAASREPRSQSSRQDARARRGAKASVRAQRDRRQRGISGRRRSDMRHVDRALVVRDQRGGEVASAVRGRRRWACAGHRPRSRRASRGTRARRDARAAGRGAHRSASRAAGIEPGRAGQDARAIAVHGACSREIVRREARRSHGRRPQARRQVVPCGAVLQHDALAP